MGLVRLGTVLIDPARNLVAKGGASWSLEPKVMDLLVLLAAHPGEVMSRDTLIEQVWKVEYGADESLTRAVSLLRKTFRDAGEPGEVIETIPKRGYRLALTPMPVETSAPEVLATPAPGTPLQAASEGPVSPPPEQPAVKRSASPLLLGALALGAVALAATIFFLTRQQERPGDLAPTDQLIAFFGFAAANDDPASHGTAAASTDAMFEAIRSKWLGTVARTETDGTPNDRRFIRAAELGARYALGGEARTDASSASLLIRFEDVPSRLTLWERSISLPAADAQHLPGQAARRASEIMWCIIKTRSEATRDTPVLLNLIADRCREGGGLNADNAAHNVARMRAVAEADPNSSYNQAQLVMMLGLGLPFAAPPLRAMWEAEAETVLQRTVALNPDEGGIQLARISLAVGKDIPVLEWDALLLEALAKSETTDAFSFGQTNGFRSSLLASTGRFTEAVPHSMAAYANDPLATPWALPLARLQAGQIDQVRADLESIVQRYGAQIWSTLLQFALFYGAPDIDAMLQGPPSTLPAAVVSCARDIRAGLAAPDPRLRSAALPRVRDCAAAGHINPRIALLAFASLGDLDSAFAQAEGLKLDIASVRVYATAPLFYPVTRAMRADPRFLPLVEAAGLMDYWRATRTQPDVCAAEPAPFCAALKAAGGAP